MMLFAIRKLKSLAPMNEVDPTEFINHFNDLSLNTDMKEIFFIGDAVHKLNEWKEYGKEGFTMLVSDWFVADIGTLDDTILKNAEPDTYQKMLDYYYLDEQLQLIEKSRKHTVFRELLDIEVMLCFKTDGDFLKEFYFNFFLGRNCISVVNTEYVLHMAHFGKFLAGDYFMKSICFTTIEEMSVQVLLSPMLKNRQLYDTLPLMDSLVRSSLVSVEYFNTKAAQFAQSNDESEESVRSYFCGEDFTSIASSIALCAHSATFKEEFWNRPEGYQTYLKILSYFLPLNVFRKEGNHVKTENLNIYNHQLGLLELIRISYKLSSVNKVDPQFFTDKRRIENIKSIVTAVTNDLSRGLLEYEPHTNEGKTIVYPSGLPIELLPASTTFVTNHMLTRFVEVLLSSPYNAFSLEQLFEFLKNDRRPVFYMLESTLRSLALSFYAKSGAYVRNGETLDYSIKNLEDTKIGKQVPFKQDIAMIQLCTVLWDPIAVAYSIAARFGLLPATHSFHEKESDLSELSGCISIIDGMLTVVKNTVLDHEQDRSESKENTLIALTKAKALLNELSNFAEIQEEYSSAANPALTEFMSEEDKRYINFLFSRRKIGRPLSKYNPDKVITELLCELSKISNNDLKGTIDELHTRIEQHKTKDNVPNLLYSKALEDIDHLKFIESALWLILTTVLDRSTFGIDGETREQFLNRTTESELCYWTAWKPRSFKSISELLRSSDDLLDDILTRDCVSKKAKTGYKFSLKPELYANLHPFSPIVESLEIPVLEENYNAYLKKQHIEKRFTFAAPAYTLPRNDFSALSGLLHNPAFFHICGLALTNAKTTLTDSHKEQNRTSSERGIAYAIIGITIAANTQKIWSEYSSTHPMFTNTKLQSELCREWAGMDAFGNFDLIRGLKSKAMEKSDGTSISYLDVLNDIYNNPEYRSMRALIADCLAALHAIDQSIIPVTREKNTEEAARERKRKIKERQERIRKRLETQRQAFAKWATEEGLLNEDEKADKSNEGLTEDTNENTTTTRKHNCSCSNEEESCSEDKEKEKLLPFISVCGYCSEVSDSIRALCENPIGIPFYNHISGVLKLNQKKVNQEFPDTVLQHDALEADPEQWWTPVSLTKSRIMESCGHTSHLSCFQNGRFTCPICRSEITGMVPLLPFAAKELLDTPPKSIDGIFTDWKETIASLCATFAQKELALREVPLSKRMLFPIAAIENTLVAGMHQSRCFLEARQHICNSFTNFSACSPFSSDTFSYFYALNVMHKMEFSPQDFCLCLCCEFIRTLIVRSSTAKPSLNTEQSSDATISAIASIISTWMCNNGFSVSSTAVVNEDILPFLRQVGLVLRARDIYENEFVLGQQSKLGEYDKLIETNNTEALLNFICPNSQKVVSEMLLPSSDINKLLLKWLMAYKNKPQTIRVFIYHFF